MTRKQSIEKARELSIRKKKPYASIKYGEGWEAVPFHKNLDITKIACVINAK